MDDRLTPLQIDGITENIYGDFWLRLWALFLDGLILSPILFLFIYLNHLEKNFYFYTFIPSTLLILGYNIYLPKKYGGTPGKLIAGIKIIRLNGEAIDWKEVILRYAPFLVLTLIGSIKMTLSILQADDTMYMNLSWTKQSRYLTSMYPVFSKLDMLISTSWMFSEFIVLLCTARKRAIHDLIAGTVVVKTKYLDKLKEVMAIQ